MSHICKECSSSLSKKEIIQKLTEQHPAHKHAAVAIIERCQREGYGITFSDQEINELLGLSLLANYTSEELKDFKFKRKQGIDNMKRELLYKYKLRFTGKKKTKKSQSGWYVLQC